MPGAAKAVTRHPPFIIELFNLLQIPGLKSKDLIQNMKCSFLLLHNGKLCDIILRNHSDDIRVRSESSALHLQIIRNDHIKVFLIELLCRIIQHIFRLHRETAQELTGSFMIAQKL